MKLSKWLKKQFKKKSRIYIFPTRMGGYLNGLIFLMFLLAVGYNNNLLLIFTLFLFGMNLMWVIQTHFHLKGLKLRSVQVNDGHAGEEIMSHISWEKSPDGPYEWELMLETPEHSLSLKSLETQPTHSLCRTVLPKRGLWEFKHLYVKTNMPFGLYQVWVYLPIQTRAHAYPSKLKNAPRPIVDASTLEGEYSSQKKGPHDVWNLAPYDESESRKISWKHYARSGELVIKEGEELTMAEVKFRYLDHSSNKESVLSLMATQMVHLSADTVFSLDTPSMKKGPGSGEKHLSDCLRILSLC